MQDKPNINDVTKNIQESTQKTAEKTAETAKSAGEKIASTIGDTAKQIKTQSTEMYDAAIDCFKKNPITSIVIAILAGTVIGSLLSK